MCKRSAFIGFFVSVVLVPLMWAQTTSIPELPPGPIKTKVAAACTECHEARIILQQRLNKAAWTKEVDKMIKWGAVVDPQDRDGFIDYLTANFGVDKPEYVADRTPSASRSKAKK